MRENESYVFPSGYLSNFTAAVFSYFGVPKADTEQAAEVLGKSDLRGIDSHGVARLQRAAHRH
jgi:LDH2 family malate/lactate/ureidoglycolate dehydrogenase